MVKWKSEKFVIIVLSALNLIAQLSAQNLRLPRTIKPTHYDLHLETHVHNGGDRDYGGHVKIDLEAVEFTNKVILHHRGLNIINVDLFNISSSADLTIQEQIYDNVTEFLTIETVGELSLGDKVRLDIEFSGKLQTGTAGFYRSQYQVKGENFPRYLAATQFEPTRARSAFPCFDEPEWRATFKLSITHGTNYSAISNMDGNSTDNLDGTTTTKFDQSVSMPTYLLAFVVSDLAYNSWYSVPANKYRQRMYSVLNLRNNLRESVRWSVEFLNILESVTNTTYKLPKLYSAALPDHGSAMENYGLILYKEQYLILEPYAHPLEKYDVVGTITHELTHQFFGNLVTCKWWDQIWLNEGFATWGEFLLPELLSDTQNMQFHHLFNIKKTQNAFRTDSLKSTRPMTFETSTNAEISDRFDRIAYDKSGAVIRMFHYMVGDVDFRAALRRYLSDNEHESITSNELMKAFEEEIGNSTLSYNFTEAFRSWEMQKGYPVINVAYDRNARLFTVTQKRFTSVNEEEENDKNLKWHIPLTYTTESDPKFLEGYYEDHFRLADTEKTINTSSIPGFTQNSWYIFNVQQHGYYRVNYDANNWHNLIKILNSPNYHKIHVLNRAQIVDDALTMAFDGYLSYDIAFGVVNYLIRETEYFPWYSASIAFDKLDYLLKGTENHEKFRKYVHNLIQGLYQHYGMIHDPLNTDTNTIIHQLARELAIDWTCRLGDEKCLKYAYNQLQSNDNIYPPLQISFYCNGLKGPNRTEEFQKLYNKTLDSDFQTERLRIIDGLSCSSNPRDLRNLLEAMLEPRTTSFRTHERRRAFNNIATRSDIGLEVLADFIKTYHNDTKVLMGESFIDGLLVSTSTRLAALADVNILTNVVDYLRNESSYTLQESTISDVANNLEKNRVWRESSRVQEIMKAIDDDTKKRWRLPKTSKPSHYKIHLDARNVQTGELPYDGEVTITSEIIEETDLIVLHTKNQEINELNIIHPDTGFAVEILYTTFQTEQDQMTIFLGETLAVGDKIQIHAKYSTELLDEIDGFYRDSYIDSDGVTMKYLATTQFQAVEARRVFPCYDEPALKAVFELSITHDESYNAVANMPSYSIITNSDGTITTHFEPTPPMSSYLNAFLVSDFEVLSNNATKLPGEALQGIWTRPGETQKAKYGLENSVKILNALEKFAGLNYSLPKLDSGAIPGKGGGMENWGFILYREAAMMYEDDISHSLMNRGVRLIAHEIVHLFFGDLVTGEWWNYLWLNEGFATDLMYSILETIYPEWHMKEFFSRNIMIPYAFTTDASSSTRSMSSELITTDDINNSFDDIAYDKAACVLRMIGYTLGEDLWRTSLNHYLNKNEYQAVNSQHLIDAVVETLEANNRSFPNFERVFRTWENQEGVPLVTVKFDSSFNAFVLTQERFFEKKNLDGDDKSSWFIPINFATELHADFDDLEVTRFMEDGVAETLIPAPSGFNDSHWFIFNKQQVGYYRVNYEESNWQALTKFLHTEDFDKIHVVNQMHLIDNAFVLAHGGYLDYKIPYDIITYLIDDTNFFTWDLLNDNINLLYNTFGPRDATLNRFMFLMSKNFYGQYKLDTSNIIPNETMPIRYGRELAYFVACNAGNEDCLRDTNTLGHLDATNARQIPRGLEHPVLCNYFKQNTIQSEWVEVFNRMNKLQQNVDYTLKTNFINALACANDDALLFELLESSLGVSFNNFNFTRDDRRNVFNAVLGNEKGLEIMIRLLVKHAASNVPSDLWGWSWQRILLNIAGSIYTESEREIFLEFLDNFEHEEVTRDTLDRARSASSNNLNDQKEDHVLRQVQLIYGIMDRVFGETTSTPGTPPSSTPIPTTTPSSGNSLKMSLVLVGLISIFYAMF